MEMQSKIKETVLEILKSAAASSELCEWTVSKIWETTSNKLNLEPTWKGLVREIVQSFIDQQAAPPQPHPQKEFDDVDVVCRLTTTRKLTISDFNGRRLLSVREYSINKDGKECPTKKGISLTAKQWAMLRDNIPSVDKAIQEMAARHA